MSVLPPGGLLEDAFTPRRNPRTIKTQSFHFPRSKAYFPAPSCDGTFWSVYLTWTTLPLLVTIHARARETRVTCLPPRGKQPGHPLTRGRQQRRYCISLNDVKLSSDWTAKHLPSAWRSNRWRSSPCAADAATAARLASNPENAPLERFCGHGPPDLMVEPRRIELLTS